ncbi:MAG TPA: hypothetical protein VNK73_08480 [Actinomycetota bacterium]|nr:hypothetical protein [Actinomycetota bacterium]
MSVPAIALRGRGRSGARRDPVLAACAAAAAAFAGLMVGADRLFEAAGLAILAGALIAGVYDWRRTVYGLLVFLPFSGIPYILLYPNVRLALLMKDLVFVIPAYMGFVASRQAQRRRIAPGALPVVLLALFALLVVVQVFNPALPNRLVGLIGVKVWLFYVPLCLIGYHLVETMADLGRLLAVMSLAAVVPALVGLVEAVLVYSGHPDLVYRWYGGAAESATQGFVQFDFLGGGSLRRIPSTFSYTAQYFSFTVSMVAITYAWWRGALAKGRFAPAGAALWLLLLAASFLSGARAAFMFVPFLIALIAVLEARDLRVPVGQLVVMPSALLAGTVVILGVSAGTLLSHTVKVGLEEFQVVFVDGLRHGVATTITGLGTGIDTNAARYAFDQTSQFTAVGGTWYESWYVKTHLELGLAGLALLLAILGQLVVAGLRRHAALRDRRLRAVSASLLALLIWNAVYGLKAQPVDLDPINVYFWLFIGVLARLPQLDAAEHPGPAHSQGQPAEVAS